MCPLGRKPRGTLCLKSQGAGPLHLPLSSSLPEPQKIAKLP